MKLGWALRLFACGSALAAEEPKFSGGDGSSCEQAVVPIVGESGTMVEAERHWLQKTYGGGALVRQALGESADGKRRYDLIAVAQARRPDGRRLLRRHHGVRGHHPRRSRHEEEHGYPHSPPR